MKRTFLEKVWSTLEVDRWAQRSAFKIVRCRFNHKGAIICFLEGA